MSDVAIGPAARDGPFRARTVALLLAIGVLGFLGTLLLGAYAPDLRSGRNGGAHALSNAAVGFSGIVALAQATGRGGRTIRNAHMFDTEDLVVLTPETGATDLTKVLATRRVKPTLVVLPKWATLADPDRGGWVRRAGLVPAFEPAGVLAPDTMIAIRRQRSGGRPLVRDARLPAEIAFAAPRPLQTMTASGLRPLLSDGAGGVVLGQIGDQPLYVLADPDLLSNLGMADARRAASALALLDWLNSTGATTISFDVTLNGFGHSLSPLKLAFDPPFLAMTIAIGAALALAGIQATARFGAPRPPERAIAFGKAALVDNSAALVRKARREAMLGGRYADMIRERARIACGVPARLGGAAADAYLDGLAGRGRFTALATAAADARDRQALLAAAQALHGWQAEAGRSRAGQAGAGRGRPGRGRGRRAGDG